MTKFRLSNIIAREDFLIELKRAAIISYETNGESGFCVYTDEKHLEFHVNKAVKGKEKAISTETDPETNYESGVGYFVPMFHYVSIDVHFHPPVSNLHPSPADIREHIKSMDINNNLSNSFLGNEKEIYEDKKKCLSALKAMKEIIFSQYQ